MTQPRFYHNLYHQALSIARQAIDLVLPARCPMTGENVEDQGMLSGQAWRRLNFIAAPYCQHCGMPFSYDTQAQSSQSTQEQNLLCMRCVEKKPVYDTARSALIYDDASRDLILGFKHGDKTYLVKSFAMWMQMAGREFLPHADVLIPVPLHFARLRMRRYNQSSILAYELGKIAQIPCLPDVLMRVRSTPPQGHLDIKERHKNVRKAFAVRNKRSNEIKGKTLVLIDDVYTTGATINECTKTLLSAGAKAVHILTLARVVKNEF